MPKPVYFLVKSYVGIFGKSIGGAGRQGAGKPGHRGGAQGGDGKGRKTKKVVLLKALVHAHQRQLANGKMIYIVQHEDGRMAHAAHEPARRVPADSQNFECRAVRFRYEGTPEWLKAPNGEDSNLNERQWLQVRTLSFKSWFGDWERDPENASKAVDENGEPAVVYHGTQADFEAFDVDTPALTYGEFGRGIYAYHSPIDAGEHARAGQAYGDAPSVMPLFLNVRNPYIAGQSEVNDDMRQAMVAEVMALNLGDPVAVWRRAESWQDGGTIPHIGIPHEAMARVFQAGGYDGVDGGIEFVAFRPAQAKSATGNTGEFNPDSPMLTKAESGRKAA